MCTSRFNARFYVYWPLGNALAASHANKEMLGNVRGPRFNGAWFLQRRKTEMGESNDSQHTTERQNYPGDA
jgi:hypothetical protein